jgi:hypothetical protein
MRQRDLLVVMAVNRILLYITAVLIQDTMIHYILNSGQSHKMTRTKVDDIVIRNMQEYMHPGAYKLPVPGKLILEVKDPRCGYSGTIFWGTVALVAFSIADTPEAAKCVWPGLERLYLTITDRGDP